MSTPSSGIYLNYAGTSWPKPPVVHEAVRRLWDADPLTWGASFGKDHQQIADYFNVPETNQLLITPACTSALTIAAFDHFWNPGDRILTTGFEHHALHRPLVKLVDQGVDMELIPHLPGEPIVLEALEESLRAGGVKLVAITAASNVTGQITPYQQVVELAHQYEARVLIDAAQVVGWLDMDFPAIGADLIAFAGHKALHGPWGIGGLYVAQDLNMNSPAAVCELTYDKTTGKPKPMKTGPGWCDGGSVSRPSLAGLAAATRWLGEHAQQNRLPRARQLSQQLYEAIAALPGSIMYGTPEPSDRLPTVAFNLKGMDSIPVSVALGREGIQVSGGMQCAPLAHKTLDTAPQGIVRVSIGPNTTTDQIQRTLQAITKLALDTKK